MPLIRDDLPQDFLNKEFITLFYLNCFGENSFSSICGISYEKADVNSVLGGIFCVVGYVVGFLDRFQEMVLL